MIVDVHNTQRAQIVLSRTDPRLLVKLFETEVPEIYDARWSSRTRWRAPGSAPNVAVYSREATCTRSAPASA